MGAVRFGYTKKDGSSSKPHDWQNAFHKSTAKLKWLYGAFQSGKTVSAVLEGRLQMWKYPKSLGLVARETMGLLKDSVMKEHLLQKDSQVKFVKGEKEFHYPTGSVLLFRGLISSEGRRMARKFGSYPLNFVHIEEGDILREDELLVLYGRPIREIVISMNPVPPDHWIIKFMNRKEIDQEVFLSNTYQNEENLGKGYIERLEKTYGPEWTARYLRGETIYLAEGERFYPTYSEKVHNVKSVFNPERPVLRGWDFGYYHGAICFCQIDTQDRLIIQHEYMPTNINTNELALMGKFLSGEQDKGELPEVLRRLVYTSQLEPFYPKGTKFADYCVVPSTLIITKKGIKRIDEVKIGDMVLTHKNRYRKVTNIMSRPIKEFINKISPARQMGLPLRTTEKHLLWADLRTGGRNKHRKDFCPGWIPSSALKRNNYLSSPINDMRTMDLPDEFNQFKFNDYKIFGYFAGDGYSNWGNGCRNGKNIVFSIGYSKKELPIIQDLKLFCTTNNLVLVCEYSEKANMWVFRINNKELSRLFRKYFYDKDKTKQIPDFILCATQKKFREFLEGLHYTDGCVYTRRGRQKGSAIITNTSFSMLSKIKLRLDLNGICSNLQLKKEAQIGYIRGRRIHRKKCYQLSFATNNIKELPLYIYEKNLDYVIKRISKNETEFYDGMIWNLEVEQDNSFVANGVIIHNSDPAGAFVNIQTGESDVNVLESHSIFPQYRKSLINEGAEIIRYMLGVRTDGTPGLMIDAENCPILVGGFIGGYKRRVLHGGKVLDEPVKEGYYEHLMDSLRMIIIFTHKPFENHKRKHTRKDVKYADSCFY